MCANGTLSAATLTYRVHSRSAICVISANAIKTFEKSMDAFKSAKQLACSPSGWIWLVLTYRSNQLY